MNYIITFQSAIFDIENEKENPINPIKGVSLGEWISPLLEKKGILVSDVKAEDWGWYIDATLNGRKYIIGFIAILDGDGELIIQIIKKRTFFEVISFKNKMNEKDSMLKEVNAIVKSIKDVSNIEVEKVA